MRILLPVTLTGCILLLTFHLCAQQGNQWYFGKRAGLNFNLNPPIPLFDGQTNGLEGTASIADENGNLLFYTDGVLVYNRLHDIMPNGSGIKGHISSFQNSLIVPQPGNNQIFYLFTTDAIENNGRNGYNYSVIDMTKDNGLGDLTIKNVLLSAPSSERITCIKGGDYKSYWVITNEWNSNIFRAYKIDCSGLDPTPVVSTTGRILNQNSYSNIGVLRISADGKLLLQTNAHGRPDDPPTNEFVQLFDFDNNTGSITNPREIPLLNDGYYWGGEFSPDSKILYLVNPFSKSIHQFDLSSGNITNIISSKKILPVTDGTLAAIAMGADLKLYIATGGMSYLHVINDPNVAGVGCNLVMQQQKLGGRSSQLGLPNMSPSFYVSNAVDFDYQTSGGCGGLMQFTSKVSVTNVNLLWDFGDGQTSTFPNPLHQYVDPTRSYLVKLTLSDNTGCLHEMKAKPIVPSGGNIRAGFTSTVVCDDLLVRFFDSSESTAPSLLYAWDFGDGNSSNEINPIHTYTSPGLYSVKLIVTTANGCMSDTSDGVVRLGTVVINAGPDIQVISSSPIQLQATGGSRYHWEPSDYLSDPDIANPLVTARKDITYVVTGFDESGCSATDTLKISVPKDMLVEVPNAFDPLSSKNYLLRPLLRMIDRINYFRVYNRWGQLVFETKEIGKGWDGKVNGQLQSAGTYTWTLEVVDFDKKIINKKGSSILVR